MESSKAGQNPSRPSVTVGQPHPPNCPSERTREDDLDRTRPRLAAAAALTLEDAPHPRRTAAHLIQVPGERLPAELLAIKLRTRMRDRAGRLGPDDDRCSGMLRRPPGIARRCQWSVPDVVRQDRDGLAGCTGLSGGRIADYKNKPADGQPALQLVVDITRHICRNSF